MVTPADAENVNPFGEPTTQELLDEIEQKYDFWNATPQLQLIAQRAEEEDISAWGLLAALMAHRASHVAPNVVLVKKRGGEGTSLSEGTSLNGFFGLVGESGGNKSVTFRVASSMIPPSGVPLPDGTGQGLVRKVAETAKVTKDAEGKPLDDPYTVVRFHRHSLTLHAPEVKTLNAEFAREGTKTSAIMCSMWVGETVGMSNADKERDAFIPANMARIVGIWGVQPQNAFAILSLAEDGTPQRFLWAPTDETRDVVRTPAPPLTTFPFPVFGKTPPEIAMGSSLPKEIRITGNAMVADDDDTKLPTPIWVHWSPQMHTDILAFQAARKAARPANLYDDMTDEQRLKREALAFQSHFILSRIKAATWLGWLWGVGEPTDLEWRLSEAFMSVVMGEAAGLWKRGRESALREAAGRGETRGVEQDAADVARNMAKSARVAEVASTVYTKLAQLGGLTEKALAREVAKTKRPYIRDAVHHLEDEGRAEYDGALWYAVYKGNKLTKNDKPARTPSEAPVRVDRAAFEAAEALEAAHRAGV